MKWNMFIRRIFLWVQADYLPKFRQHFMSNARILVSTWGSQKCILQLYTLLCLLNFLFSQFWGSSSIWVKSWCQMGLFEYFRISLDFHVWQSIMFKQNGVKTKHPVSRNSADGKVLLMMEVRGEWWDWFELTGRLW